MTSNGPSHAPGGQSHLPEAAPAQEGDTANGSFAEESSTLDHALLESLFYNEMMMLDASSPSSSTFLNQHFNEATHPAVAKQQPDPNTIVEKEMLHDFGVAELMPQHNVQVITPSSAPPASLGQQRTFATTSTGSSSSSIQPPSYGAAAQPAHMNPTSLSMPRSADQAAAVGTSMNGGAPVPIAPAPPKITPTIARSSKIPTLSPSHGRLSTTSASTTAADPPHTPAKQLVDQFATLASRLGISLPDNVLQSLTVAAAKNNPHGTCGLDAKQTARGTLPTLQQRIPTNGVSSATMPQSSVVAPIVHESRRTADEAVSAVSAKRRITLMDDKSINPSSLLDSAAEANYGLEARPIYSKRRKKPRLSDCESRLAELRAENEQLQRHLQNVTNKAHQFNQEKIAAGLRIERLHESEAGPQETDEAVQKFSDMYSDYGSHRQQELSFHLEQLKRLVNPTNFTKMGLWTLGQTSLKPGQNPIAGILQQELDITPQQGRKILDQSEKIRALCENLKESLSLLHKLKSLCEKKTNIFHDRINRCREILESKQVIKLIMWINEHTELLESVCPGWGTEQHIHSSSASGSH